MVVAGAPTEVRLVLRTTRPVVAVPQDNPKEKAAFERGKQLWGFGTDDCHYPGFDIGDGWTMVRAAGPAGAGAPAKPAVRRHSRSRHGEIGRAHV